MIFPPTYDRFCPNMVHHNLRMLETSRSYFQFNSTAKPRCRLNNNSRLARQLLSLGDVFLAMAYSFPNAFHDGKKIQQISSHFSSSLRANLRPTASKRRLYFDALHSSDSKSFWKWNDTTSWITNITVTVPCKGQWRPDLTAGQVLLITCTANYITRLNWLEYWNLQWLLLSKLQDKLALSVSYIVTNKWSLSTK